MNDLSLTPIKVFIASPGDVQEERNAVEETTKRINRNYLEREGFTLRVYRWETDSHPGFHVDGPQGLIDESIHIEDFDIVIGIFWKRIGTPTNDGTTGTEHEIMKAYEAWKRNSNTKPHIMLYFNQKEFISKNTEEAKQHLKVLEFKENFPEALTWTYNSLDKLKSELYDHLSKVIEQTDKKTKKVEPVSSNKKKEKLPKFTGEKGIFVGREEYLENKIKNELKNPGSRISIVGPGGSGKSQLAFKALHQYYEKDKIIDLVVPVYLFEIASISTLYKDSVDSKITNINIPPILTFKSFLNAIGSELRKSVLQISKQEFEQLSLEDSKSLIINEFEKKKHPLLYCDNFETLSSLLEQKEVDQDIKSIFNFINNTLTSKTSVLITSRNIKNFIDKEKRIDLGGLEIDEGIDLFIKYASTYENHFTDKTNPNIQGLLKTIVTKTGGHPLSIEILAKTYDGGGVTELKEISETFGKERNDPTGSDERLQNLHSCFNYSIEKLDSDLQKLLPSLTIFQSLFTSEAVEKIFDIPDSDPLLKKLFNKSLLSRIEGDEYGPFTSDKFWIYSIHLAIRNYLEEEYKDFIKKIENESIPFFCNYYFGLIINIDNSWGKEDHNNYIRLFNQITKSEISDFDRAIEFAINIKSEQEKLGKEIGGWIETYLGILYLNLGYYDKSLHYYKKTSEISEELNNRVGMARDYNIIGVIYRNKGQLDEALKYHNKALEISEESNDRVCMASVYGNIGLVLRDKGQLDEALKYHNKALEIYEELNDRVGMARVYGKIGLARDKCQLDEALKYHNKSWEIREELNDRVGIAIVYGKIGLVLRDKGQLDEALKYHNKALEIYEELNDRVGMARVYGNIGLVLRDKGQLDEALKYHNKSLEINKGLKYIVEMVRNYTHIGYTYLYKKNKKEAKIAADTALKIVKEFETNTGHIHPLANLVEELISKIDKSN